MKSTQKFIAIIEREGDGYISLSPDPTSNFKICAYKCKGYAALATFPWPKDRPCPQSFDENFPGP